MINNELQLKLQAHLDGELPPGETRQIEDRLARDAEARALCAELAGTAKALAGYESEIRLPESREFFWSKIEREIQRESRRAPAGARASVWAGWRRLLAPLAVASGVALAILLIARPPFIPVAQADIADPGAFTYRDSSTHTTLVWLSYPAENELAENEGLDTMD